MKGTRKRSFFFCFVIQCIGINRKEPILMLVTKDTLISEVLNEDMGAAECFFREGMFCVGCPASAGESIGEACAVHGISAERLIDRLNAFFGTD